MSAAARNFQEFNAELREAYGKDLSDVSQYARESETTFTLNMGSTQHLRALSSPAELGNRDRDSQGGCEGLLCACS